MLFENANVGPCWTETKILDVLKEVEDYALESPVPLFYAYDKLAEKIRAALQARISYQHLIVQVSEGDHPPKDISKDEIEEWNASAVKIPNVDPSYGTYARMWKQSNKQIPGSPGPPVVWCLSRSQIVWNSDVIMHVECVPQTEAIFFISHCGR